MTHEEAVALIRPAVAPGEAWAELGAGTGTFTRALAELVGEAGAVWASDRDENAVRTLRRITLPGGRPIRAAVADLTRAPTLPPVDGILLANALHFAADQETVLRDLAARLSPGGKLLLVEYDQTTANPWVPHPIPLASFRALAGAVGLTEPVEVGRRPSRYQGEMYAAMAYRATWSPTPIQRTCSWKNWPYGDGPS